MPLMYHLNCQYALGVVSDDLLMTLNDRPGIMPGGRVFPCDQMLLTRVPLAVPVIVHRPSAPHVHVTSVVVPLVFGQSPIRSYASAYGPKPTSAPDVDPPAAFAIATAACAALYAAVMSVIVGTTLPGSMIVPVVVLMTLPTQA